MLRRISNAPHRLLMITILFVVVSKVAFGSPLILVDQENPGPFQTTNGAFAPFSFGQSFTPALSGIDSIKFLLGGNNSTVIVNLRDGLAGADGLSGSIIAQSLPVLVNKLGSNIFHFDFASRVSLIPGQEYVAELSIQTGSLGVRHTQNNEYTGGQFLHQDFLPTVFAGTDLVFSEGLHISEPTTLMLVGLGVLLRLRARSHLLRCSRFFSAARREARRQTCHCVIGTDRPLLSDHKDFSQALCAGAGAGNRCYPMRVADALLPLD